MKVSWFHRFGGPEVMVCEDARKPTPGTAWHVLINRSGLRAGNTVLM